MHLFFEKKILLSSLVFFFSFFFFRGVLDILDLGFIAFRGYWADESC